MNYRRLFKEIMPPILTNAIRKRIGSDNLAPPLSGSEAVAQVVTFPTYQAALLSCQDYGYEDSKLVNVVLAKTKILRDQLQAEPYRSGEHQIQIVLGLSLALLALHIEQAGRPLHVIDVGGGAGAHYFAIRSFFAPQIRFCWSVVETPAMALAARELENAELHFYSDLNAALQTCSPVDMVFSSGTIQCVPNPRALLADLVSQESRYLLLSRMGATRGARDVICVHQTRLSENGPGPLPPGFQDGVCQYPFSFIKKPDIDAIINERYKPLMNFKDDSGIFSVNDEPIVGFGCLYERLNWAS